MSTTADARRRPRRAVRDNPTLRTYPQERLAGYLMLLPTVLPYVAFAVLPIAWLLRYSFYEYNGFTEATWVGTANYERVMRDTYWWAAVLTTIKFAAGQLFIMMPLSLLIAYAIFRGLRGAAVLKTIYFLPYVLSMAVVGIIFSFFLRLTGGPLNDLLLRLRLVSEPVNFLGDSTKALLSLISVGAWANFGIVMLLLLAGMTTIPKDLIEAAQIDGAGELRVFWHIILPLLYPILRVVLLILIISTLRAFDLVKTLTDGGPAGKTDVMFTYLYSYFFEPETIPQIGYAAALGVVASVIVAALSSIYLLMMRRKST